MKRASGHLERWVKGAAKSPHDILLKTTGARTTADSGDAPIWLPPPLLQSHYAFSRIASQRERSHRPLQGFSFRQRTEPPCVLFHQSCPPCSSSRVPSTSVGS